MFIDEPLVLEDGKWINGTYQVRLELCRDNGETMCSFWYPYDKWMEVLRRESDAEDEE